MENPHRFKVGDRVVIVHDAEYPNRVGVVTTISGPLEPMGVPTKSSARFYKPDDLVYPVDLPSGKFGERADRSAMPEWIRRLTKQRERA